MGATSAELVIATFFNFEPDLVRRSMAGVWDNVTPAALLDARRDATGAALRRILGPEVAESSDVEEAAGLARRAAEAACAHLSGKPLFAGHASLPWPDDPLLVLWHAQTLLREFRGDIHIAAMTAEGIDGCEALVTHAATGDITREILQGSRVWSDDQWDAAVESLRAKGHLDSEGSFTDKGARESSAGRGPDRCRGARGVRRAGRRGLQATPVPLPADVRRRSPRPFSSPCRGNGAPAPRGAGDAPPCRGLCVQTGVEYWLAAHLACGIGAVQHPLARGVDLRGCAWRARGAPTAAARSKPTVAPSGSCSSSRFAMFDASTISLSAALNSTMRDAVRARVHGTDGSPDQPCSFRLR